MNKKTYEIINKIREAAIKRGYEKEIDDALNEYYIMNGSYRGITELHIINTCISIAYKNKNNY